MPCHRRPLLVALTLAFGAAVTAVACGGSNSASTLRSTERTIDVTMNDSSFQPARIDVAKGETVTLRFTNNGAVTHEAVLGDDATQMAHHAGMAAPTGAPHHGHADSMPMSMPMDGTDGDLSVAPGSTAELTHTFTEAGHLIIGCHEPGHWEAGMKATITIN